MSLFTNGNARITRLIIVQVFMGVLVMVLTQVIANLPAQDWLTPHQLKVTSFVIGTLLTAIKGIELFFTKTVALLKGQRDDELPAISTVETSTKTETIKTP